MDLNVNIENLGAVNSADIDIKPLTIFIGKNNTGKTWTATTICGLLDERALNTIIKILMEEPGKLDGLFDGISDVVDTLSKQKSISLDLVKFVVDNFDKYFTTLSRLSPEWLNPMIGTSLSIFENTKIHLRPNIEIEKVKEEVLKAKIDDTFHSDSNLPNIRVIKEKDDSNLIIIIQESKETVTLPPPILREIIYKLLVSSIHDFASRNVYYLPAERTGIVTFLHRFQQHPPISNNDISSDYPVPPELNTQPIQTLISRLKLLENSEVEKSLLQRQYTLNQNKYAKFADIIEKEVLGGEIVYESTQGTNSQVLHYNLDSKPELSLEMFAASSTVKDLVPLVMYLRYFLNDRDRILIDEPEMNLHPENQARFMEFITLLVNSGVRVLMVTHSPYMVNHLESLLLAGKTNVSDDFVNKFYLRTRDSFISQDNLSIYLFEDGTAKNILSDDGIDLSTYDTVANQINDIYVGV